jgi:aspartate/methionine/tyrosine aminotransferase
VLLAKLRDMGVRCDLQPEGTFYVWGRLDALPAPLSDCMGLFRAALDRQVITVPGIFFDVNPGKRRSAEHSRFKRYMRFSFGPSLDRVELACERLTEIVRDHS